MKKILIVPANTDLNRGDQSLTWASIDIAKTVFGESCEVFLYRTSGAMQKKQRTNHQTEALGYPMLERILAHPRRNDLKEQVKFNIGRKIIWGGRALKDLFTTGLLLSNWTFFNRLGQYFLSAEQEKTLLTFKELDMLLIKGGGFLHSYGSIIDPYIMYFQLFDVFLANRYNIPVIMLPNSVGPLKNCIARRIVINGLKKCNKVFVREIVSEKFIKSLDIECSKSPDLGFYLKPSENRMDNYLRTKGIPIGSEKNIAITLRPYRFNSSSNSDLMYKNYLTNVEFVIRSLICDNRGYHVSLIAHTIGPSAHEDDRKALLAVKKSVEDTPRLHYLDDPNLDSRSIEKIYEYYEIVIGTRFHSVIFALNVETPAIAIAYGGHKATGIMKDMGLSEYVVPIENPQGDDILKMVDSIERNRKQYIDKIKAYKENLDRDKTKLLLELQAENYIR